MLHIHVGGDFSLKYLLRSQTTTKSNFKCNHFEFNIISYKH